MLENFKESKHLKLYKTLFQVVFWSMWLLLPIFTQASTLGLDNIQWNSLLKALFVIPIFYINTNYLIPKVLKKQGLSRYLLYLFVLVVLYCFFNFYLQKLFFGPDLRPERLLPPDLVHRRAPPSVWLRAMFPVVFISAISSFYGFVNVFIRQEQLRKEESDERMQSELSLLRSQVSPHFLFNTLNSILYLVRTKSERAEELVLKLSELLRYMIYDCKNDEVPLSLEVEYLHNYIELQRIRFGEDIEIFFEAIGVFDGKMLEPMLIIPFVENAFKHGASAIVDPKIIIRIEMTQNLLHLNVGNKYSTSAHMDISSSGIGLENVYRRLDILYNGRHELKVSSEDFYYNVDLKLNLN